jgi:hypothetical protein
VTTTVLSNPDITEEQCTLYSGQAYWASPKAIALVEDGRHLIAIRIMDADA